MTAHRTPGIYHLVLCLKTATTLRVGRLGRFTFPAGCYVYTGSAINGLEARIARHRRGRKRLRWHIDYLLPRAGLMHVIAIPTSRPLECQRNRSALALPGARVIVPGFGSSDCRCPTHLVYLGRASPVGALRKGA